MGVGNEPPAGRSVSPVKKAALFAAPFALVAVAWGGGGYGYIRYTADSPPAAVAPESDGAVIYDQQCAYCHGVRGDGNGTAIVIPPARAFGVQPFKFASTANQMPTDDDLLRVLKHGIPGSAMPKFDHLSDAGAKAVVAHVRALTRNGVMAAMAAKAIKDGDEAEYGEYQRKAAALTEPGPAFPVPATFPPPTPESLANGRRVFLSEQAACASCHGQDGKATNPPKQAEAKTDVVPVPPRDLTAGVFKGGREREQVYLRIKRGIPGVAMSGIPATVPEKDVLDLVNFVLSMSPGPVSPAAPAPTPGTGT